jgi:hypothetical protein
MFEKLAMDFVYIVFIPAFGLFVGYVFTLMIMNRSSYLMLKSEVTPPRWIVKMIALTHSLERFRPSMNSPLIRMRLEGLMTYFLIEVPIFVGTLVYFFTLPLGREVSRSISIVLVGYVMCYIPVFGILGIIRSIVDYINKLRLR